MNTENPFKQMLTENDGISWCIGRALGTVAGLEMMIKFAIEVKPDFIGFGTGLCAIIAAIAAKNYSERVNNGNA
jgi:hypothetical protein